MAYSQSDTTTVVISGTVTEEETGVPVEGAIVNKFRTTIGSVTNEDGYFSFRLPLGLHTLIVKMVGMEPKAQRINLVGPGTLDFQLKESAVILDKVIIEGKAPDINVREVISGISRLDIEEIKNITPFLGEVDVIKSLQTLPGVSTVGEGASGFNVRGGRVDQNLILQNGGQLFNASHVLGFFSAFNPDLTDNFTLYKGNIPAQYGGRISSVLDVSLREGDYERYKVTGGLGLVASRLVVEGPIIPDKTTFIIGGRASYSNYLLKRAKNEDVRKSSANFHDLNFTISHRIKNNNRFRLSFHGSHDFFRFADEFGFSWDTQLGTFQWQKLISSSVHSDFTAVYGNYSSMLFEPTGPEAVEVENGIRYFQIKENILYSPGNNQLINAGLELIHYDNKPETQNPYTQESGIINRVVNKEQGREISVYINDEVTFTDNLSISAGLRYTIFQNIGPYQVYSYDPASTRKVSSITDTTYYDKADLIQQYGGIEPRLAVRYQLNPNSSIKLSYTKMRQYIHSISNTTAPTPIDVWQLSNKYVKPQVADNFSIGYFRNYANNTWEISMDAYYRNISNLVEYKDFVELLINDHLETDLLSAKGRAYGAEVYVKKSTGKWTGWLSYTFSRSEVQVNGPFRDEVINRGEWFPTNYDKPHNLTLVLNRKLGSKSSFNTSITYSTGRPISGVTSSYEIGTVQVSQFSDRNEFRIPDYFRVDLSFTIAENVWKHRVGRDLSKRRYKDSFSISVYNLFSRNNAYSVFFRVPDEFFLTPRPHQLSVLGQAFPAITYNFKF